VLENTHFVKEHDRSKNHYDDIVIDGHDIEIDVKEIKYENIC